MRKIDGFIISVLGLGLAVGSLGPKLGWATTLLFSIGLGVMLGGVFKEIREIKEQADE